ncbi:MAG: AgmX/PglI C-terminal domain-containing protein [Myxococcota bacterium]
MHLIAAVLTLTLGCASAPTPPPTPQPIDPPAQTDAATAEEPNTEPERGRIVAVDSDDTSYQQGEALERAAQRYGEQVEALFAEHQEAINQCYLRELKKNPQLAGHIVVKLLVVAGGTLDSEPVFADNTLGNTKVEGCIAKILKTMRYPEPYNNEYAVIERLLRFGTF